MRAVNLLPADRRDARRRAGVASRLPHLAIAGSAALGIAAVGAISLLVWTSSSTVSSRQKQLDALQGRLAAAGPEPGTAPAATAPTRLAAVTTLSGGRVEWDRFLDAVSRVMPEDVWLQSLSASSPGSAAAAASVAAATAAATAISSTAAPAPTPAAAAASADAFSITGFTYSQPSVARLLRRLGLVPWLTDVSLVSSSKTAIGSASMIQFTVEATLVPKPAGVTR